jgi:signal transduction histidine kinase
MKAPKKFNIAVVVVAIAMVVILPLLAYLQYTWLGELSKQEYKRMQQNVRTAAFHSSMEFSMDVTEIIRSLAGPLEGSDETIRKTVGVRMAQWNATTTHHELSLKEYSIGTQPSAGECVEIRQDEQSSLFVLKNLSAVAIAIQGRPHAAVIVPLNARYLLATRLPEIIQTHFTSQLNSEYDIIVTDNAQTLLWRNAGTQDTTMLLHADIVETLLRFPPVPLKFIPEDGARGEMKQRRDIHGEGPREQMQQGNDRDELPMPREEEHRRGVNDSDGRPQSEVRGMRPDGPDAANTFDGAPGPANLRNRENGPDRNGLYQIHLRHRDGSLETAVERNRNRSLAISFSVLLLLGSSVIFLLIAARRAQFLAHQQMEFVAGVSHELRTPLAVLKGAGENLADGVIHEAERARQYGELIKKEVIRLSEMVEKALTYAAIQSGKQSYELQLLDLALVIDEAVDKTERLVRSDDAVFDVVIEDGLPMVFGNAEALRSAVENLMFNAVKYSGETIWVGVEVKRAGRGNSRHVDIIVKDHGIGIAPGDLTHIFTPFYRAGNAMDGQIQGNGLGLSITRHIVDAHRGRITVASVLNEGSTFTIELPIPKQEGERG